LYYVVEKIACADSPPETTSPPSPQVRDVDAAHLKEHLMNDEHPNSVSSPDPAGDGSAGAEHDSKSERQNADRRKTMSIRFGALIATTAAMFVLMRCNTHAWDHVRWIMCAGSKRCC